MPKEALGHHHPDAVSYVVQQKGDNLVYIPSVMIPFVDISQGTTGKIFHHEAILMIARESITTEPNPIVNLGNSPTARLPKTTHQEAFCKIITPPIHILAILCHEQHWSLQCNNSQYVRSRIADQAKFIIPSSQEIKKENEKEKAYPFIIHRKPLPKRHIPEAPLPNLPNRIPPISFIARLHPQTSHSPLDLLIFIAKVLGIPITHLIEIIIRSILRDTTVVNALSDPAFYLFTKAWRAREWVFGAWRTMRAFGRGVGDSEGTLLRFCFELDWASLW